MTLKEIYRNGEYKGVIPLSDEEELLAVAGEKLEGAVFWEHHSEENGDQIMEFCPFPDDTVFRGRKAEALAAARVYQDIAPMLYRVKKDLEQISDALTEDHPDEVPDEDDLYHYATVLNDHAYALRGLLREGRDSDQMDTEKPCLYLAIYEEMVRSKKHRVQGEN